jgi:hypothetical protein
MLEATQIYFKIKRINHYEWNVNISIYSEKMATILLKNSSTIEQIIEE